MKLTWSPNAIEANNNDKSFECNITFSIDEMLYFVFHGAKTTPSDFLHGKTNSFGEREFYLVIFALEFMGILPEFYLISGSFSFCSSALVRSKTTTNFVVAIVYVSIAVSVWPVVRARAAAATAEELFTCFDSNETKITKCIVL